MLIFKWVLAILFFICFLWIAIMNGIVFWQSHIKKLKTSSWIPLIGGILGLSSLLILPIKGLKLWCWLPLIIDWGSIPGLLETIIWHFFIYRKEGKEKR